MRLRLIVAITASLALAACGSTKTITKTVTVTHTVTAAAQARVRTVTRTVVAKAPAKPKPAGTGGNTGGGQTIKDFSGNTLRVAPTLIDPAQPANSFDDPSAGDRLVAIRLKLTSEGPGTVSDDANNDTSLIGSDGQDYSSGLGAAAGCTNFNSGAYTIGDHQTQIGCVVFDVPTGVKVKAVQFALGNSTIQFNAG